MYKYGKTAKQPDAETIALRLFADPLQKTFFLVRPAGHEAEIYLCLHKVLWIEADNNCSHLHMVDSPSIKVQMKISRVEAYLAAALPDEFIRINRSEIINLRWLDKVEVYVVWLIGRIASFSVGKTYRKKFNRLMARSRLTGM